MGTAAADTVGIPTLTAARLRGPITIDGKLTEAAWARARPATHFVQGEPEEGAAPAEPTEVRILYDDEALYVGAHMTESDTSEIVKRLVRRDQRGHFDYFEVDLDPNLDRQTGYLFRVSAAGVQTDQYLFQDSEDDTSWDAVWGSAVSRDSTGWSVEMRIPFSQIRYEAGSGLQTWGIDFARERQASNSRSYFALISRTTEGRVSQFGRLTGLRLGQAGRRLELEPYVATQLLRAPSDPSNPLFDGTDVSPRAGVNVSYGIGSAFSLDATVNPDFGQVEVDPAVINLSAFETFFPEKRPFFVQDARIFDFGLGGRRSRLFFSRRIGRAPRGDGPEEADFISRPDQTTILGATKLTGRTAGGLAVGALGAVTQRETGAAYFAAGDSTRSFVAQPRAEYGVGRLRQDFRGGASRIGGILTGMHRDLPSSGVLDGLTSSAFSGGLDFKHDWGGPRDRDWSVHGHLAGTYVRGSTQAITDIQENSQHYFQRPDAPDLSVDSTATSMTGMNWQIQLERQSAEHWTWSTWIGEVTPGFAANDLGFNHDGEHYEIGANIDYQNIDPGPIFRSWRLGMFTHHSFRHQLFHETLSTDNLTREYSNGFFSFDADGQLLDNWDVHASLDYGPQTMSDTKTRGGPLMVDPGSMGASVSIGTDPRSVVSVRPHVEYGKRTLGDGHSFQASARVSIRPTPSVEIQLRPSWEVSRGGSQYVTTDETGGFAPTFGERYLFGVLHQKQLSMETRLNVAFSPTLSLQLFVQPLIASGHYSAYRQLADAGSYDFVVFPEGTAAGSGSDVRCTGGSLCRADGEIYLDYDGDGTPDFSFENQDFNVRSLRGNAVLRWEFRPGSILYFVWQQSRRGDGSIGAFDLGRELDGLVTAPPTNTFIVKASYFLDL